MKRALAFVVLLTGCGGGDFLAHDDFTYSDEDWVIESEFGLPTMSLVEADENGTAPFICGNDKGFSGARFWRFRAPNKYLGNASRAFGQRLTWDTSTAFSSGTLINGGDIFMTGRGLTIVVNVPNSPRTTRIWAPFSVFLDSRSPWRKEADGYPLATDDEIRSVLRTLTALKLPGEWRDGEETSCIDNVFFGTP